MTDEPIPQEPNQATDPTPQDVPADAAAQPSESTPSAPLQESGNNPDVPPEVTQVEAAPAEPPPAEAAPAETTAAETTAEVAQASAPAPASPEPAPEAAPEAAAAEATEDTPPAADAPAEDTVPAVDATQNSGASARVREKLGNLGSDRAVGSEDILTQRPDTPTDTARVDIPTADDLDADLEAEISSALETAPAPTESVPVPIDEQPEQTDANAPPEQEEVGPGSTVTGSVQHIHGDDVFLNAGLRSDVMVSSKQFEEGKVPAVGDSLTVIIDSVDEDGLFRARLPQARTKSGGNWDGLAVGQVVDCMVTAVNKGGLQVTVSSLKGFLPASQVDLGFVSNLEQYVGQKLSVQITEVKPRKKNLVVSRRALLQSERESQQADFWKSLEIGQDHTGTVKTIKNYGAFVNLGPIDGFLHIGEVSWSRINHPNEVLNEGQEIQVRVLKIDQEKNRISLGLKQLIQNPWLGLSERYPTDRIVSGKVTRVADFGAFVELEPGVEGLVHISQLAWRRVGSVNEVLKVNDEHDFQVLEVDQKRKRVSLSLKALEQKPESMRQADAEEESRPPRKENPDLRGGMGQNSGAGGLFGNPSDFT